MARIVAGLRTRVVPDEISSHKTYGPPPSKGGVGVGGQTFFRPLSNFSVPGDIWSVLQRGMNRYKNHIFQLSFFTRFLKVGFARFFFRILAFLELLQNPWIRFLIFFLLTSKREVLVNMPWTAPGVSGVGFELGIFEINRDFRLFIKKFVKILPIYDASTDTYETRREFSTFSTRVGKNNMVGISTIVSEI
jgi:hypothetical protein